VEAVDPDVLDESGMPKGTGVEAVYPDVLDNGVDSGMSGFCALRRALNCFCRSLLSVPLGNEGLRVLFDTSFRNLR
jgi:hypothetical protein